MERTRTHIIDLLADPNKSLKQKERREYEWDLWVIMGILEHGMQFTKLERIKNEALK